jgi:hypothetical protein
MLTLRRRLASWALALLFCQTGAVFAAPFTSCCATPHAVEAEQDCCPAGSHPPGQCPRHAAEREAARSACRMRCDAPHGVQFLPGVFGLLAAPVASIAPSAPSAVVAGAIFVPTAKPSIPDSPPPRR